MFNQSKRKRLKRRKEKKKEFTLKIFENNVNSLGSKMQSLQNLLKGENPSAVFLQDTKLGRAGRIRTPTSSPYYTWYELHRTEASEKGKGALGVINCLEPSWISEGDDDLEAITVEVLAISRKKS